MSSPVQKAVSAAFKLFSRQNHKNITRDNLKEIISHLNQVTKSELKLNPALLVDSVPTAEEPPVTYVRILENKLLTICMFIVKQGKRLPLHDHPGMFGFIKVIHGSVKVKTYTPSDTFQHPLPQDVTNYMDQHYGPEPGPPVLPCQYHGTQQLSETDDCGVLTPAGYNIHEVVSDVGTAAFFDILSPSYDHSCTEERRPCSYFKELDVDSLSTDIKYLIPIRPPNDYWCDEVEYAGPEVESCVV